MQPITITSFQTGLKEDLKPYLPPEDSLTRFENAYIFRNRIQKRHGLRFLGRLQRNLEDEALAVTLAASTYSNADILTTLGLRALEPDAEIAPGTITITIDDGGGSETQIVDTPTNGTLIAGSPNNLNFTQGYVNYVTGTILLNFSAPISAGLTVDITFSYFPALPVVGISQREIASINDEETIFFDTMYSYRYLGGFEEFIAGTTWDGADNDFFWTTNYRGILPQDRLFFVTNFNNTAGSPMRYTDGATWTTFAPLVDATNTLWQAAILIPYYGRLVALNCTEGLTVSGTAGGVNIFNRCRFSQIGSPIAVDAWRSDQFGKGGFLDAPTNEAIIGATFIKNTLIVEFERSHWELRYVGEYGLPFIWERISADFGSESRFSGVTFDEATLCVGSTAIIAANANGVQRIDENIPDAVFNFRNAQDGTARVIGVRDYQKELVYWTYVDSNFQERTTQVYPQKVLIYNYRLGAFSQFRQNVTFFGHFQKTENITWSSTNVFWDDTTVTWEDVSSQSLFPNVVCGNQQGYIHYFNEQIPDDVSQSIQAIDRSVSPVQITSSNHNLVTGDIIMFKGVLFVNTATGATIPNTFDDRFFQVTFIDLDTFSISEWDGDNYANNFTYTPANGTGTYVGGGQLVLFPKMLIETNDFNPWLMERKQVKLTRIDFLFDVSESANVTVIAAPSASALDAAGNVGNFQVETYDPYAPSVASDYLWHRFYLTMYGQFARVRITYGDNLMNTLATHQQDFVLNAMTLWLRPGGSGVHR